MAANLKQHARSFELDSENDRPVIENIVIDYLQGLARDDARFELKKVARHSGKSARKLSKKVKVKFSDGKMNPYVKAILANLRIDENSGQLYHDCFVQKNLYELLAFLSKVPNPAISEQIKDVKALIDGAKPPTKWGQIFLSGSFLSIASIVFFHYRPNDFHDVVEWFQKSIPEYWAWLEEKFSLLRNAAVVGMGLQSFLLLNEIRQIVFNDAITRQRKVYEIILNTIQYGLNIAGYAVMFTAAGLMTPISMVLFITGAFVNTVSGLLLNYGTRLWQEEEPPEPELREEPRFQIHAEYTRRRVYRERNDKAVWLEAKTAALAAIVIVLWCVLPPSIPVSFGCMLANVLIMGLNRVWAHQNRKEYANKLQSELSSLKKRLLQYYKDSEDFDKVIGPELEGDTRGIKYSEKIKQQEEKISSLTAENLKLRQGNDELAASVRKLKAQLANRKPPENPPKPHELSRENSKDQPVDSSSTSGQVIQAAERFSIDGSKKRSSGNGSTNEPQASGGLWSFFGGGRKNQDTTQPPASSPTSSVGSSPR